MCVRREREREEEEEEEEEEKGKTLRGWRAPAVAEDDDLEQHLLARRHGRTLPQGAWEQQVRESACV
jgi:hypothetical protein